MILVGAFSLDTAEVVAGLFTCEAVLRGSTPATSTKTEAPQGYDSCRGFFFRYC